MFTETEITRIFSWLPYRDDWPVNRNLVDDNISLYYGQLIETLTTHKDFSVYYAEDGNMGNYLEFICYPSARQYKGKAIDLCISLCAPLVAYGQTDIWKENEVSFAFGGLFPPDAIGFIDDPALIPIGEEIRRLIKVHQLILLDGETAIRPLPEELLNDPAFENLNEGNFYLQGFFQKTD